MKIIHIIVQDQDGQNNNRKLRLCLVKLPQQIEKQFSVKKQTKMNYT